MSTEQHITSTKQHVMTTKQQVISTEQLITSTKQQIMSTKQEVISTCKISLVHISESVLEYKIFFLVFIIVVFASRRC